MEKASQKILDTSPIEDAEEWAIHDYKGFGDLKINEHDSLETIVKYLEFIEEHEELGLLVLAVHNGSFDDAENTLENYIGEYDDLAEYAYQVTTDCADIPAHLASYIDYESMGRDMGYDLISIDASKGVHLFHNC